MDYCIKRLPGSVGTYRFDGKFDPSSLTETWKKTEKAEILDYSWLHEYPDHFYAAAHVTADENGLNVLMYARENPIIAKEIRFGGNQYLDSCLEFFLCPFPEEDNKYLNIEINPIATAHVGIGDGRNRRKVYSEPVKDMRIETTHSAEYWAISFNIPRSLFISEFGKAPASGQRMKGNFYKCSGPALHEHYGCWNHVAAPHPDFHRPECFGAMTIE